MPEDLASIVAVAGFLGVAALIGWLANRAGR